MVLAFAVVLDSNWATAAGGKRREVVLQAEDACDRFVVRSIRFADIVSDGNSEGETRGRVLMESGAGGCVRGHQHGCVEYYGSYKLNQFWSDNHLPSCCSDQHLPTLAPRVPPFASSHTQLISGSVLLRRFFNFKLDLESHQYRH